jgi:hypothetical protein
VRVEGITTAASGGRCVTRDRPEARRLWERAAYRYANGALMPSLWAEALRGAATVGPDSFGAMDTTRAVRDTIAGSGRRPVPATRDRFYAQPPLFGTERSFLWDYPLLESVQAWHFGDVLFGELNHFQLAPRDVGELVVEFCSRQDRRPYIAGRLYLGADTTMLKAEWRIVTSDPAERAGGEVVFMPPAPGAPLLAASGHFWRAKASGFYQEWNAFLQWYVCEGPTGGCGQRRALGR